MMTVTLPAVEEILITDGCQEALDLLEQTALALAGR